MPKEGQTSVTVPNELWDRLEKYRAKHGLRSVPAAISHALDAAENRNPLKVIPKHA